MRMRHMQRPPPSTSPSPTSFCDVQTPLITPIKCTGHKVSRSWQMSLETCGGGEATRPAVKRQQLAKVKLNRVTLKLEDNMYLIKTCDPVRQQIQLRQCEPVHKGSGHIDSRWECTIFGLVETNGMTIVMGRLQKLHLQATPDNRDAPTLGSFKAVIDANKWQEAEWWEALFFEEVSVTVTHGRRKKTTIERRERNLSTTLSLDDMYDAYQGPHVLPQQEVLTIELDTANLSRAELAAAVAEADKAWKASRNKAAANSQTRIKTS